MKYLGRLGRPVFFMPQCIGFKGVMALESIQRDILIVLLGRVFELGLISEATYKSARNSLASLPDLPEILWCPVCLTKEEMPDGSAQDTG